MTTAPHSNPPSEIESQSPSEDNDTKILPFDLQGTRYCVESDHVVTALGVTLDGSVDAASDPWYAGEIELDEQRLRVVDLARVVSTPTGTVERSNNPKLLVFETTDEDGRHYSWLVDSIGTVTQVETAMLTPTRSQSGTHFVAGQLEVDGETLIVLDERALNG